MSASRILLAVAIFLNAAGYSQESSPVLLNQAIFCLKAKRFLKPTGHPSRSGYFLTTKWYPGDRALYVVIYSNSSHTHGSVFTLFITGSGRHRTFNIQNNAEFVRTRSKNTAFKKEGVDFVSDPLWGIWTQEHIAMAVQEIAKREPLEIQGDSETKGSPPKCKAYTDAKENLRTEP